LGRVVLAVTWLVAVAGLHAGSVEAANALGFVAVGTTPSWLQGAARNQPMTPVIETLHGLLIGTAIGHDAWSRRCSAAGRAGEQTRGVRHIVDLSHPISDGLVTYPGLPGPVITDHLTREASRERYEPGYEFQIGRIEMVANTGTYLDTPFHRFADGHDLAGLDLARVAAVPGVVVDATARQEAALPDGVDIAGRAVLFATRWDRHWGTDAYGDPGHPFVGMSAVARLVAGGAAVVGIDSVNIDDTRTGARLVHTALLGAGIPIVEHLRGLDQLAGRAFTFTAVPPAVVGMGTFPVRAFAVLSD
jgi:kynurenine formamidase